MFYVKGHSLLWFMISGAALLPAAHQYKEQRHGWLQGLQVSSRAGSPPAAPLAGSSGGKRRGAGGWGRGAPLQTPRRAGGRLAARTGPAGRGAAAATGRGEPPSVLVSYFDI